MNSGEQYLLLTDAKRAQIVGFYRQTMDTKVVAEVMEVKESTVKTVLMAYFKHKTG